MDDEEIENLGEERVEEMWEGDEDFLRERVKEMIENDIRDSGEEKPEMRDKRNEMDEKAERDSTSEIPGPWDPHEVEFLANNRTKMDNDEMEDFLKGDTELQQREWSPFSRSEERFILQHHRSSSPGEIAESLDRSERAVELQMMLMGLKEEEI